MRGQELKIHYRYSEGGHWGLSTPQYTTEKNSKHCITAKTLAKHRHHNLHFGRTIII